MHLLRAFISVKMLCFAAAAMNTTHNFTQFQQLTKLINDPIAAENEIEVTQFPTLRSSQTSASMNDLIETKKI